MGNGQNLIDKIFSDAKAQADEVRAQAQKEADEILSAAQNKADKEKAKADEAWAKRCMVEPYPGQKKK